MSKDNYSIRVGKGISWSMTSKRNTEILAGFTVDNLDTKLLEEAEDKFEEVFITVRLALERYESSCLDVEEERLRICQGVFDSLKKNKLL